MQLFESTLTKNNNLSFENGLLGLAPFSCTDSQEVNTGFGGFNDLVGTEQKKIFDVYHDGSHYIAVKEKQPKRKGCVNLPKSEDIKYFDELHGYGLKHDIKGKELRCFIYDNMLDRYDMLSGYGKWGNQDLDAFIDENIKRKLHNAYLRKKRAKRKLNLNRWNYFVSVTRDPKIHKTEQGFKKTLKKCLANLCTRRGWRYIGVFELAPNTDRLHFHAIMYVPDGEMVGTIEKVSRFDKHLGKPCERYENTFFNSKFGITEFDELRGTESALNYLLKYLNKDGGKLIYSRGIPSSIGLALRKNDIAAVMLDFVEKYILFDDVMYYHKFVYDARYTQIDFFR